MSVIIRTLYMLLTRINSNGRLEVTGKKLREERGKDKVEGEVGREGEGER